MSEDLLTKAKQITYRPKDRLSLFREASLPEQSVLMSAFSPYVQQDLLRQLSTDEVVDVLDHMDIRAANRVVRQIANERMRNKVTIRLKAEIKEKVERFLLFHPKATMSLVHFSYVYISQEETIGEVADAIEEHHREVGKFPEVLVHNDGVLEGEVRLSTLVRERNNAKVKNFIQPVTTISYKAEVSEIVEAFTTSDNKKVVMLDEDGSVLGIVYADDALGLFGKLPAESLYQVAGVDSSEQPLDMAVAKFTRRYRWLILNLITAFFAGSVILLFQPTLNELAIMAVFIPIVAGMGGNAASQAFAVMLRGISLGTVTYKDALQVVTREAVAGLFNGLVIGVIVSVISIAIYGDAMLGVVVGLTMVFQHIIAAIAGSFIPLYLKHIKQDPAVMTSMLMTTVTDVFGIAFLLGMGTWLLL